MDVNNVVKAWNDEWTLNILDFAQIVDLVLVFGFNDEHNSEGLQIYNQLWLMKEIDNHYINNKKLTSTSYNLNFDFGIWNDIFCNLQF